MQHCAIVSSRTLEPCCSWGPAFVKSACPNAPSSKAPIECCSITYCMLNYAYININIQTPRRCSMPWPTSMEPRHQPHPSMTQNKKHNFSFAGTYAWATALVLPPCVPLSTADRSQVLRVHLRLALRRSHVIGRHLTAGKRGNGGGGGGSGARAGPGEAEDRRGRPTEPIARE